MAISPAVLLQGPCQSRLPRVLHLPGCLLGDLLAQQPVDDVQAHAVPDGLLDFQPHEETNPIRTILVHQLLSERRFFAQFVSTEEPPLEELLPAGEKPIVQAYVEKYVWLVKRRLPQLAKGTAVWWLEPRPFFGGLQRERIWVFWRRVLHTCHHRTQVQSWLRLAGQHVPAIYGPSGDVKWEEADPTYSLEAAKHSG
jgi:uncharacterized damage-inducible protein DinB